MFPASEGLGTLFENSTPDAFVPVDASPSPKPACAQPARKSGSSGTLRGTSFGRSASKHAGLVDQLRKAQQAVGRSGGKCYSGTSSERLPKTIKPVICTRQSRQSGKVARWTKLAKGANGLRARNSEKMGTVIH